MFKHGHGNCISRKDHLKFVTQIQAEGDRMLVSYIKRLHRAVAQIKRLRNKLKRMNDVP